MKAFQKVVHLALFVELELAPPTRLTTRHSTKQCHKHRPPRLRLASSDSYAYGHNMGLFNYYAFGLPSFVVLVIALYLLFTGTSYSTRSRFGVDSRFAATRAATSDSGEAFNVGRFLEESSPYAWASTGIGLCIGFSVLGAGWYVLLSLCHMRWG